MHSAYLFRYFPLYILSTYIRNHCITTNLEFQSELAKYGLSSAIIADGML